MAENKKSFVLYADLIHTLKKLPNEKAGELFKHILSYVNDENPNTNDLVIDLAFEPIKQQLKRDLKKWETQTSQRSEAGKKGMEKRWKKDNNDTIKTITENNSVIKTITKITDNVNVNVSDSVNDILLKKEPEGKFLVRIGIRETYTKPPSEVLENEYRQRFETTLMTKLKGVDRMQLLKEFDKEYSFYEFSDANHLMNALAVIGKKILREIEQNKPEVKIKSPFKM